MEFALRSDPANERLALGLGSAQRRAARSQELLERFAATGSIDLIRYRLISGSDIYAVEAVADSVHAFQRSFTGAADFLKAGPKAKAKYSREIEAKTRLNFAYTYPGSLGIVLAVENERDLLKGELDEVIDVFSEFLDVSDSDAAVDASRHLGPALVTQLCRWVDVNAKWETAVDLVIKRPDGVQRGQFIEKNRFFDLSTIFHNAKDEEPNTFDAKGILVGLDIEIGKFHLVVPGGESFQGGLADDFVKEKTTVGAPYLATINEKVSRVVATGNETRSLKLQKLVPVSTKEGSP
ncbi:hypothetical protein HRJ34_18010 [Rhizorhabdus wittichii]|uniref:Uncharacterized protein n=1 Tax=Rhizorhabdus wittichii TaxID=160791 RepID=A0A975CZQ7_9SPHN|nr:MULTISPECIES: hypothetical protein [Sphingomonadaceae]QTH20229.1 hypothetical protein HRJ34_18010 [Rhizorhabdus wittichii]